MQMLTSKDPGESPSRSSAFKPVGACAKSPGGLSSNTRKRDSGYSSDFSPARVKTHDETFTFDEDEVNDDDDGGVFVDDIDISADEYVYERELHELDSAMNAILEHDATDDEEVDREVQELLHDSENQDTSDVTHSGLIHRPVAPIPSPDVNDEHNIHRLSHCRSEVNELCLIASPYYHTRWNTRDRVLYINPFRPIVSRSVGTQTPNPHCQLLQDPHCQLLQDPHCQLLQDASRLNPDMLNTDLSSRRGLQDQSRNQQTLTSLPDVVPMSRDRSISLPDVQSFHRQEQQQQVGRELRRISDDYHSTYLKRQIRRTRTRSEELSLLRLRVDVPACWNTLRRLVSSSPLFQAWSTDDTH